MSKKKYTEFPLYCANGLFACNKAPLQLRLKLTFLAVHRCVFALFLLLLHRLSLQAPLGARWPYGIILRRDGASHADAVGEAGER